MATLTRDGILEILLDWNNWGKETDTGIERADYLNDFERKIGSGEIVVLQGVRRSGKSTIARQFVERLGNPQSTLIINFEDIRLSKITAAELNRIFDVYLSEFQPKEKPLVVLDEIQVVKGWERFVRFLHEKNSAKIAITGSSSKLLSGEYATLITGRHINTTVYPLSFGEFLQFNKVETQNKAEVISKRLLISKKLREYLEFGGFPKPTILEDATLKKELLRTYYEDIVQKDIQKRYSIKEGGKLDELGQYYLTNNARLASFNKIRKTIGLSLDSVQRFSRYMEEAYLIFFAPIFSYSKKAQIVNPKKVFPIDTGLRNSVSFRFSKDFGWNAENAAFLHLKRLGYDIYYYADQKTECDFIAKKQDKKIAIQVAWNLDNEQNEIKGLLNAMEAIKAKEGIILTEEIEEDRKIKGRRIRIKPLWKWMLEKN
ncbi:MAG TPA: ATP-binding protein [archaeon]|nr:ATP-binding protein [archaeon]